MELCWNLGYYYFLLLRFRGAHLYKFFFNFDIRIEILEASYLKPKSWLWDVREAWRTFISKHIAAELLFKAESKNGI